MNLSENIKMALESILANKLRSFLTMLGIIIGISSVIAIVSLGEGGKAAITGEFAKLGASGIIVKVNPSESNFQPSDYITEQDISAIKDKVPTAEYATPYVQKTGMIFNDKNSKRAVIMGTNPDIRYISDIEMAYGRMFNERESSEGSQVIVIDENTAKYFFGYSDVVGKTLNVGSKTSPKKAVILGVSKSSQLLFGIDQNMPAMTYVPVRFEESLFSNDFYIDTAYIMADKKENNESTGNSALNILHSRHNNRERNVYRADTMLKQLEQINRVVSIFTTFIGAVAAISLIVGGIGVMNIMLVSVTERTKEIGIRKAIGATTSNILLQFLTESILISLLGGIIGMTLGIIGAEIVGSFAGVTPIISVGAVLGVIFFSSAVGIFFGIYPARKAAGLDPIDALRYE